MARRHALLDISASRLELSVFNGSDSESVHAQRINLTDLGENWPGCLESLSGQLAALVTSASASGLETTVLFQAPSSAVVVTPVPAEAGKAQGLQAAMLALGDAANRPLSDGPHDLDRIWTDPESESPDPRQAHYLGIADSEGSASALTRFVRASGLDPVSLVPSEAPGVAAAVDAAIERSQARKGTVIGLYIGEHISTLAAAIDGRLKFVRRLGAGTEMLVEALAKEVRTTNSEPIILDRTQAAQSLFLNGIPVRGNVFDQARSIHADSVLPLIQPVLQRCTVEIKQSLRFGLEEKDRADAALVGLGAGASIGRLLKVIAEQCGLSCDQGEVPAGEPPSSTAGGAIRTWVNGRTLSLGFVPGFLGAEQTVKRVRRGMLIGFGVAAAFVGYSAVTVRMDMTEQRKGVDAARANLAAAQPLTEVQTRMMAAQLGVTNAKQRIASRLATATAWDGAMFALSQCTPSTVKISECVMLFDHGKPVCRITGQMPMPAAGDANAVLRSFLDALNGVPLVKSTRLGTTQRIDTDRGPIQSFEMNITLHELPAVSAEPPAKLANAPELGDTPGGKP